MANSFWNVYRNNHLLLSAWPFVFIVLSLASVITMFLLNKKINDSTNLEDQIKAKVEEERIKILSELNKNKEEEKISEEDNEDIKIEVTKIIPKGKFNGADSFAKKLLSNLAQEIELAQGIFYIAGTKKKNFSFLSGYAITKEDPIQDFILGENLNGQAAQTQEMMIIDEIPENYFNVESGLGKSKPKNLILIPIVDKKKTIGLLELAFFIKLEKKHINLISAISKPIAEKLVLIQKS
jgi:putative methionine-R-sulfoxide reductase with GAF domain